VIRDEERQGRDLQCIFHLYQYVMLGSGPVSEDSAVVEYHGMTSMDFCNMTCQLVSASTVIQIPGLNYFEISQMADESLIMA
jgi:roadblock/LC7 domain-containing protein